MCFGGGDRPQAPTNPAPYSLDEGYKAVDFTATDTKTGQQVASKPAEVSSSQKTVPEVLSTGLNVKGM